MTHRPPNGLLVFLCQAISVSPSTSLLVLTCWPYTDRSADHTSLSSHVAQTYDNFWSTAAASGTPAEDMAEKAGWICSAGSSGSASSLRSIRCVRALSRYTPSPNLLSNRSSTAWLASITIITVQLLTDMLAYYKCTCLLSMWLPHIPTYTRRNGARFLPQVYRKDTSVCRNNLISISVTISISASCFVGAFDCRRVGLSASCPVTGACTGPVNSEITIIQCCCCCGCRCNYSIYINI